MSYSKSALLIAMSREENLELILKPTWENGALRKFKFNPLRNSHCLSTRQIFNRRTNSQFVRVLGILGFNLNF
ncbi:hypothetical protein SAMN05444408_101607 [Chryseobacterium takakiae]|uniref:Uncharacterized protein n=1 Tax=Chryseobacterium takakiae TaxID=1302685 RepID=A0A1M4TWL8_9FLAO|nr:hypothetical protein SAMN05444408_101607 [Chryseobacterium takakiae]